MKRGNEVSSSSQTRFIVGVGHGGCGLADSSVFGTKSFNSYRLDSSSWIRLRVFDDSIHSMAFMGPGALYFFVSIVCLVFGGPWADLAFSPLQFEIVLLNTALNKGI